MKKKADIQFHFEATSFDLNTRKVKQWILKTITQHHRKAGEINIIFCRDPYLRKLNIKFLNHDYDTDILTFQGESSSEVEGELYISLDTVKSNAKKYRVDFELEILRVIIHGVFHLLGYSDKTSKLKKEMRTLEDKALEYYHDEFIKREHYFDQVYDLVRCIPKGRVTSYGHIANYLSLGSARMVGWALNKLKDHAADVPAHRVVNAKGELSGRLKFGEHGERMGKLLRKEKVPVNNYKVEHFEKFVWDPSKEL